MRYLERDLQRVERVRLLERVEDRPEPVLERPPQDQAERQRQEQNR